MSSESSPCGNQNLRSMSKDMVIIPILLNRTYPQNMWVTNHSYLKQQWRMRACPRLGTNGPPKNVMYMLGCTNIRTGTWSQSKRQCDFSLLLIVINHDSWDEVGDPICAMVKTLQLSFTHIQKRKSMATMGGPVSLRPCEHGLMTIPTNHGYGTLW